MGAFHVLLSLTFIFCRVGRAICVIVWVMLRLLHFYCIHLLCSTDTIILMMHAKNSYSEWFYTWLAKFLWFCWFLVFSGVCWYVSNCMCVCEGPKCGVKFSYQFIFGMINIVVVCGSCLAASLVEWMVVWASVSL